MTGADLYEKLREANLVAPVMTDAEVVAAIERIEAEEVARAVAGRYPGDRPLQWVPMNEQPTLHDRFMMAALPLCYRSWADTGEPVHDRIAELARKIADACIEVRRK